MALDLALVGGRVRTLDPDGPSATALGISDGLIAVVGSDAEVREQADGGTEIVDLGGAAAVPGLTDAHVHPLMGAEETVGADLMDARTLEEVRDLLRAEAERVGPGAWVVGFGLDYNVFADSGIRGDLIEDAVAQAPAFAMFFDFHVALVTRRALELAGVDGPRTFEENAEVVCVDGRPTGELRERGALDLVRSMIPERTEAERYRLYADAMRAFAAVGLTGVHGMDGSLATHDSLRELEERGDLVTRIVTPFWISPEMEEADWEALLPHRDVHGRRWRGGTAKFFIDGVIDAGTAWLYAPDSEGQGTEPFWPDPAKYREAVRRFAGAGYACTTHACGDYGVHEALEAYRAAGATPGVRHRIEHIETLDPADLPRFAAEGVVASMQAQHMMELAPDRSDNWSRRLGEERCDRAFPTRSIRETGAASRWDPTGRWRGSTRASGSPPRSCAGPPAAPTGRPTTIRASTASPRSRATRRTPPSSSPRSGASVDWRPGSAATSRSSRRTRSTAHPTSCRRTPST